MTNIEKYKTEAKEKGLILIKKLEGSHYLYESINCGHTKEAAPAEIRKIKSFICKTCILIKQEEEAKEKGLTLINPTDNKGYNLYQFKSCLHKQEYSASDVRRSQPVCKQCQIENFKSDAKSKNLILLRKSDKPDLYLYKFNSCQHTKEYAPRTIKRINPICTICQMDKFQSEAKERGLKIIGDSKKHGCYLYQFIKCEHTKEYSISHVRDHNPICEQCGLSHFNKQSHFYIINIFNDNESFLKIGIANDIKQRIKTYKLKKGYKAELLQSLNFISKYDAVRFEKEIEKNIKQLKLESEKMKKVMNSGYTECYPFSVLNKIKQSLLNSEINHYEKI